MPNIDVVAIITAKPGSESIVEGALEKLATASKGDQGCVAYDLYASESTPGAFITVEKWASQADIDAHMASPHILEMITTAGDHLGEAPAIHTLRTIPT